MLWSALFMVMLVSPSVYAEMEGSSDNSDWAFQWYIGEPFRFTCNTTNLNVSSLATLMVKWDTPIKKGISMGYDDEHFQTVNMDGVNGKELLIKNVQPALHGVYQCHIFETGSDVPEGKVVLGLNIHEPKYREAMDKYRHNIIVAFVATAVFIVPVSTACFIWKFQYTARVGKDTRGKKGKYEPEMNSWGNEGIATTVQSPEGQGAYENPDTRL